MKNKAEGAIQTRWWQWTRLLEHDLLLQIAVAAEGRLKRMADLTGLSPAGVRSLIARHGLTTEVRTIRERSVPFNPDAALARARQLEMADEVDDEPSNVVNLDAARAQAQATNPDEDAPEPDEVEVPVDEDEVELPETTEEIDANDDEVAANAGPDEEADEDEADDGGEVEDDDADLDEDDGNDQSA